MCRCQNGAGECPAALTYLEFAVITGKEYRLLKEGKNLAIRLSDFPDFSDFRTKKPILVNAIFQLI
jgi:hypothetical protein